MRVGIALFSFSLGKSTLVIPANAGIQRLSMCRQTPLEPGVCRGNFFVLLS